MWSTLENIIIPTDFTEAISAKSNRNSSFFSGGSYLVSERNQIITTLIDINNLINTAISESNGDFIVGSGVKLESIVKYFTLDSMYQVTQTVVSSCPSKNIRNQSTIGGEIARQRVNSDFFVYLNALNPVLNVKHPDDFSSSIREWDGKGIVNKVVIKTNNIKSSNFQRFALIPSAPAFIIICAVRRDDTIDIAIGGKAKNIFISSCGISDLKDNYLKNIAQEALARFEPDHFGSLDYKYSILHTGLRRMAKEL
jgi:hypothetical protein